MKFAIVHEAELESPMWDTEAAAVEAAKQAINKQGNTEPFVVVEVKKRVRPSYSTVVEDPE